MLLQLIKSILGKKNPERSQTTARRVLALIQEKRFEDAKALLGESDGSTDPVKLALLGEVEFHLNRPEMAETLFFQALKMQPGLAEGHHGLSLLYYEAKRYEDALAQAQYARNQAPGQPRILAQLGLCHIATNEFGPARDVLRQAVLLGPENVPALNNYAIALHAMGNQGDAWYYLRRALTLNPQYVPARENLERLFRVGTCESKFDADAATLESSLQVTDWQADPGENDEVSIQDWEERFARDIHDSDLALQLVRHYLKTLQLDEAADVLNIALAQNQEAPSLLLMSALLSSQLGQINRAIKLYEKVLATDPDNVDALIGLSQMLRQKGDVDDALKPMERAAALRETPQTLLQLVFSQCTACRYEECLANCDRVEALAPELEPFLSASRAVSHAYLGQFSEALEHVNKAQQLEIANVGFQVFRGMIHLMHENYLEGWQGYHYRFFLNTTMKRLLPYRVWQGEDLSGKTILVLAEQGLGDQVMFASCLADLLARHPARVFLEANKRVHMTLARSFPQIQVIPSRQQSSYEWLGQDMEPDFYVPLADLPRVFRNAISDFPDHRGYLVADPARIAYWREQIGRVNDLPKVGITWRGGTQVTRQVVRTLSLEQLEPLLSDNRIQFVCLQYGEVGAELEGFAKPRGLSIMHFPEAIEDLDEFAALIGALDLVITVCNTTVHYTGALGRECWVMAPFIPEWRYGLTSPGMRWYPSVRMFRQQSQGDWLGVLDEVVTAIDAWINER
jgi:tetratricopeptide (TPR) repeat protein